MGTKRAVGWPGLSVLRLPASGTRKPVLAAHLAIFGVSLLPTSVPTKCRMKALRMERGQLGSLTRYLLLFFLGLSGSWRWRLCFASLSPEAFQTMRLK